MVQRRVSDRMFREAYADVFKGDELWARIGGAGGRTYAWDEASTYVRLPPYFVGMAKEPAVLADIEGARILAVLGDSITTDHISPAGSIAKDSPAGRYLIEHGVMPVDFNSYGARRGNHEVMVRGTFANIRLRNEMADGRDGGWTRLMPDGELMTIYDAAMRYQERGTPLVVIGGKEYGSGSSRDWAAKGVNLLGVKAVIVESFERIHRSNLVGMGVLPLTFKDGQNRKIAAARRQRDDRPARHRWRHHARHGRRLHHPPRRRRERKDHADLPDRHPGRGRLLPPRRHPAFRAAPAARAGRTRRPRRLRQLPGRTPGKETAPAISETCRQTSLHPAHPL